MIWLTGVPRPCSINQLTTTESYCLKRSLKRRSFSHRPINLNIPSFYRWFIFLGNSFLYDSQLYCFFLSGLLKWNISFHYIFYVFIKKHAGLQLAVLDYGSSGQWGQCPRVSDCHGPSKPRDMLSEIGKESWTRLNIVLNTRTPEL